MLMIIAQSHQVYDISCCPDRKVTWPWNVIALHGCTKSLQRAVDKMAALPPTDHNSLPAVYQFYQLC